MDLGRKYNHNKNKKLFVFVIGIPVLLLIAYKIKNKIEKKYEMEKTLLFQEQGCYFRTLDIFSVRGYLSFLKEILNKMVKF